jgi:hypothetical protein
MSEPPTPELRAVAERLFDAARAERPQPVLGRRLDLLASTHETPLSDALHGGATRLRSRGRGASGLALCAAAATLILGVWSHLRTSRVGDPIRISAEHGTAPRTPSSVARPGAPAQPEVEEKAQAKLEEISKVERGASQALPRAAAAPSARTARPPAVRRSHEPEHRRATPTLSRTPQASAAAPPPSSLRAELEGLESARAELRAGHAERALDLLERRASERTENGLDAEATVLHIEALAALGREPDASELAARFVHDHPTSALADRARSFIRGTPGPAQ